MKRSKLIVLALLLLIAAAFFFHRETREEQPRRLPKPAHSPVAVLPEPALLLSPPPQSRPPAPKPVETASGAVDRTQLGIVRGGVRILGTPPRRKIIKMHAEPQCVELHSGVVLSDDLVVNPYGGVRWAFVYVKSALNFKPPDAPESPVILDQIVCVFSPHVLGIRVGQPLLVRNSDPYLHTVHGIPFLNPEFNFGQQAGVETTRTFEKREIMFRVKCDIHPWMTAWIGVLDHPYFAVTEETGRYAIPNLPAGKHVIGVWHEKYASVSREIDLPPGGDFTIDFILDARKE